MKEIPLHWIWMAALMVIVPSYSFLSFLYFKTLAPRLGGKQVDLIVRELPRPAFSWSLVLEECFAQAALIDVPLSFVLYAAGARAEAAPTLVALVALRFMKVLAEARFARFDLRNYLTVSSRRLSEAHSLLAIGTAASVLGTNMLNSYHDLLH